jgi:hypothetical protein
MENHGGMISTGENPLICPSEFSGNPITSCLVANQEELGKGNDRFGLQSIFIHISK